MLKFSARFAFFALLGWFCTSLAFTSCRQEMTPPAPAVSTAQTYLALGDSYTIGEAVPEAERWPVQLAALLKQEGIEVAAPRIIARTGWTTAELRQAIGAEQLPSTFDMVSLLIGVNNQYRGQSVDQYRQEFRQLLQMATGFAKGNPEHVLVLSVPDWGVTPFAANRDRDQIAREIDQFNAVAKEEAQQAGVRWVDVTPVSRTAAGNPALVAPDNLHFSGAMYREWAKLALPVAKQILKP